MTAPDPYEGRRWRDIPLRLRLTGPRRRRYLRYLLRYRLRVALLLPGDRAGVATLDIDGEVVRVDRRGVTIRDDYTGALVLADRTDLYLPAR